MKLRIIQIVIPNEVRNPVFTKIRTGFLTSFGMTSHDFLFLFAVSILFIGSGTANAENTLRWAADAEGNAPYIFQDPRIPTKLIGFEIDIIEAIASEMGVTPKFFQNQWDGLIPGLDRNDYDLAINGIEITEDRKREVNFSLPYYITSEQIVVRKDYNEVINLNSLKGKSVGCLKNSLAERILQSAGNMDIRSYEGEVNAFEDLKNKRIDAALVDAPIALFYASWNPELKITGNPVGEVIYGIALRKIDTLQLNKINIAIEKIKSSGQLRTILERWNLWNYPMALYLNSLKPSQVKPDKFDAFISSQLKPTSFKELMDRYISFMPLIGEAAWMTIKISVCSMILAIFLGLFIALTRVYSPAPFSVIAVIFIEIIRGTPLLIQLLFIFYALPSIGIMFPPFVAAVLGLGINYAAYEAENYRAGLFSVPRGQMEAAIALGMTRRQALRHIVLPQAFRLVIPPVTNDFISLLKDSSLVSVITLVELTKLYNQLASSYYDFIGTGIIIALVYLLLGLPFVKLSKTAENYFAVDRRKIIYR